LVSESSYVNKELRIDPDPEFRVPTPIGDRKKRNSKNIVTFLSGSEFGVGIGIELCKQRIKNRSRPGVPSPDPDWGQEEYSDPGKKTW